MASVYGIDLGTTYSCIAKCDEHEHIETLKPIGAYASDETSIPSIVYFDEDGTPVVGKKAKNYLTNAKKANRTIDYFKRHMGKTYCPEEVLVGDCKRLISPMEGSACVLRALISTIPKEERNGIMPKAVITIPVGYNNDQCQFVKNAAKLAGINVLGLIHEPAAAAISYGIKAGDTVLVFDLGGGTLDVSVVRNDKGNYEELAIASDVTTVGHHIGGVDWDEVLIKLAVNKKNWVRDKNNRALEALLKEYAEECKMAFSDEINNESDFKDINNPLEDPAVLYHHEFVQMSNSLLDDCVKVALAAIQEADNKNRGEIKIDYCVMAGGSSNLRMVKDRLSEELADRIGRDRLESEWLKRADHPERAIAEGAARYAYRLEHGIDDRGFALEQRSLHSYGTTAFVPSEGRKKIINLVLPSDPLVFKSKESPSFQPEKGQGKKVTIDVWENESLESIFDVPSDEKVCKKIYDEKYEVESENSKVKFNVSRDKDGIITIEVVEGSKKTSFPVMPSISKEIINQIKKSIKLFDEGNAKIHNKR